MNVATEGAGPRSILVAGVASGSASQRQPIRKNRLVSSEGGIMTTDHGDIYVPCEECGHVNTLRQVGQTGAEERFLQRICRIIDSCDYGRDGIAKVVARDVAERILKLFDPTTQRCTPRYRIQIYVLEGWRTLELPLHDLSDRI